MLDATGRGPPLLIREGTAQPSALRAVARSMGAWPFALLALQNTAMLSLILGS
jgi:hypothetical protein